MTCSTRPPAPRAPGKRRSLGLGLALLLTAPLVAGCGDDQDPAGAADLWERIHDEQYRSWDRAPGYASRQPSDAPHGDAVDIFVNAVVQGALTGGETLSAWPDGSLIVKDGFDGGSLKFVAAMEKVGGAWFWAEWDGEGSSIYSGDPDLCTGCHGSGADMVRAFGFPKP